MAKPTNPTGGGKQNRTGASHFIEPTHIVGIGASAGGLEALGALLDYLPKDSGMGFVIVQHLSPHYKSFMVELLSKHTGMSIVQAEDGMKVEANRVYMIPPKQIMTISSGLLKLTEKLPNTGLHLSIDIFLRSLAGDIGDKAIAVILSGTGSDGSKGIHDIKKAGGIVFVQDEQSAKFDGMPRSAVLTGSADYVLNPKEIAEELVKIKGFEGPLHEEGEEHLVFDSSMEPWIDKIYRMILQVSGIDFSFYKKNSIFRRIERRMQLSNIADIEKYVEYLEQSTNELYQLRKDLLIGVTHFFRDPQAFELLHDKVISRICETKQPDAEIRVWVAACSTGEEAYSIAILFREYMDLHGYTNPIKIFATDLEKDSIDFAAQGIYPETISKSVPPERLENYFTRDGDTFMIRKEIRKMIVFAPHNITKDPPFSNLDLITCRNMLIYLQSEMQKKIISMFHFALNQDGFLFLGPSETIGRFTSHFAPFDRKWNIFQQRETNGKYSGMLGPNHSSMVVPHVTSNTSAKSDLPDNKKTDDIYMTFVDEHMEPCLVIDENHDIVHMSGSVSSFLNVSKGRPSWNIYKMLDSQLAVAITTAAQKVRKDKLPITYYGLKRESEPEAAPLNMTIKPFSLNSKAYEQLILVSLEESVKVNAAALTGGADFDVDNQLNQRMIELEEELRKAEEKLQATVEELETSNEELQATNEELVAANEELQSTNEELQSVNEELVTVNTEFQYKIQELTDLNNDMDNFLNSTKIGTIFLDTNMCIRRYTPAITSEIHLMDVDYGRPISHLSHNFKYEHLLKDCRKVLKTLVPLEREIQSKTGKWYSMRILPYRTFDHQIKGIVMTFVDITELKTVNEELVKLSYAIQQSPGTIVITDTDGRIEYVNPTFMQLTGYVQDEVLGKNVHFLIGGEENGSNKFKEMKDSLLAGGDWTGEFESRHKDGRLYWESVKMLPIKNKKGETIHYLRMSEDITDQKHAEELLRKSEMLSALGQMAAGIAHEIRNPLTALKGFTKLISSGKHSDSYISIMAAELERIELIVSELLILAKPQALAFNSREITPIIEDVIMLVATQAIMNNVEIETCYDDILPEIHCVENQLKQVFLNVLKNAIESMKKGGKVTVRVSAVNQEGVVVEITDQGSGIPKALIAKLGEPFYSTKNKGTGLGLMVSYKIIENHQGTITVNSIENEGTTVSIFLPTFV
ncbi:chemotaxis protein CheB [Paenibacillus gansuensis]|uniref:Chemotaxis protein CheB n=1 Tax=Paenibacillus gansuensis TaxID=306542 RepID=A0ABW5PEK1_9BACL